MNAKSIDELLAAAAPIADADLAELDLADLGDLMREVIMSAPVVESTPPATKPSTPKRRWRFVAAAAAVAVVVGAVIVSPSLNGRNGTEAWAAEVLAVAEASPRLLVDLPGWEVVRADEFTIEYGEMTFSNGERMLDLNWRAAETHDFYVDDRAHDADPPWVIKVNGLPATVFRYAGTNDFTTLWLDGEHSFEARGVFADRAEYEAILEALEPTDIDSWLSAMPESVVKPDNGAVVVAEMLEGVPLPAGFDIAALVSNSGVSDRYQLGARVTGSVACAWIEQWIEARATGDTEAEAEAVTAMQSSRHWPILQEMTTTGAFPQALWEYADAMQTNDTIPGGRPMTIEESYDQTFGCSN